MRKALPYHQKGFATFGYEVGWRHSEIAELSWDQVVLDNGIVRLETGETKNDDARTVYLDEELKEIFQNQWDERADRKKLLPYVFVNQEGANGITRFDKAWKRACKDVKIGIKHFHDLRRTACRNMIRAGIPERVAMTVSGHKTRSVFDRYNIVNDADLKLASIKQDAYIKSQMVTKTVTVHDFEKNRQSTTG
jgi:integrase